MDIVEIIGSIGFTLRIGHKLTGLLFLWWRKEYRFDRMRIHLTTAEGKRMLWGWSQVALITLTASWFILPYPRAVTEAALAVYVFVLGMMYAKRFRHWRLPPVSPKVMAMLVGATYLTLVAVGWSPVPVLVTLAVVDLVLFPVTAMLVFLLSVPTYVYHWLVVRRAVSHIRAHPAEFVIGITGSYGKTSVKEYLAVMLSSKYPTLKTEASKNSPIGIAETVQKNLSTRYRAFVVEMGAYKKGEIAFMASMVHPEIGIITAINPQHQDLFGSIEVTMQAKYELLHGLVGRRIAIVNLDDAKTRVIGEWAHREGCEVWGYTMRDTVVSTKEVPFVRRVFRAEHIVTGTDGISFVLHAAGKKVSLAASVLGKHQASNILAAAAAAVASGMTLEEIARAVPHIRPAKGVMEVVKSDGPVYINDTFNNNPDAAKAAIAYLETLPGKKILVFQPMVELGAYAENSHEEVGRFAAGRVDAILLTNTNHYDAFVRGVRAVSKTVPVIVATPEVAATYIRSHAKKTDTVLFKGKDAEHALMIVRYANI